MRPAVDKLSAEVTDLRWKSIFTKLVPGALMLLGGVILTRTGTRSMREGMSDLRMEPGTVPRRRGWTRAVR